MAQSGKLTETYWVENLADSRSVFRGSGGSFTLEAQGFVGSIQEVPRAIAFDPWIKRAESRGKLRFLASKEAVERIDKLTVREVSQSSNASHLMKALEHGAAEDTGRFINGQDLPDEAEARQSVSFRDIWDRQRGASVQKNNAVPAQEVRDAEGLGKVTLTQPVKEGEWESQSGL